VNPLLPQNNTLSLSLSLSVPPRPSSLSFSVNLGFHTDSAASSLSLSLSLSEALGDFISMPGNLCLKLRTQSQTAQFISRAVWGVRLGLARRIG
jgi:hypothetical protein